RDRLLPISSRPWSSNPLNPEPWTFHHVRHDRAATPLLPELLRRGRNHPDGCALLRPAPRGRRTLPRPPRRGVLLRPPLAADGEEFLDGAYRRPPARRWSARGDPGSGGARPERHPGAMVPGA